MVLFDDAHFWPKMRMKIQFWPRPNMGSTSTPRPNQRHQQVAWAYSTTSVSFFWRNKPYIDFVQKTHFKFMASSGELCQICAQLRGALRALAMGHNGFLWSCKVKLHSLGAFWAVCQFRRALPELAGARQSWLCDTSKSHNCSSIRSTTGKGILLYYCLYLSSYQVVPVPITITNTTTSGMYGINKIDFYNLLTTSKVSLIIFMIIGKIELISIFLIIKKIFFKD